MFFHLGEKQTNNLKKKNEFCIVLLELAGPELLKLFTLKS